MEKLCITCVVCCVLMVCFTSVLAAQPTFEKKQGGEPSLKQSLDLLCPAQQSKPKVYGSWAGRFIAKKGTQRLVLHKPCEAPTAQKLTLVKAEPKVTMSLVLNINDQSVRLTQWTEEHSLRQCVLLQQKQQDQLYCLIRHKSTDMIFRSYIDTNQKGQFSLVTTTPNATTCLQSALLNERFKQLKGGQGVLTIRAQGTRCVMMNDKLKTEPVTVEHVMTLKNGEAAINVKTYRVTKTKQHLWTAPYQSPINAKALKASPQTLAELNQKQSKNIKDWRQFIGSRAYWINQPSTMSKPRQSRRSYMVPAPQTWGIDKNSVRKVIRTHHHQLKYCYEKVLVTNPSIHGQLMVKFVIDSTGKVTEVSASKNTLGDKKKRVEQCVLKRFKMFVFPAPKKPATVHWPLMFRIYK